MKISLLVEYLNMNLKYVNNNSQFTKCIDFPTYNTNMVKQGEYI